MQIPVVNLKKTGQNICALREQSGISVWELQYLLGFATPQAIYKWQHGDSLTRHPAALGGILYQ